MLIGRRPELGRMEKLVADLTERRGGALAVRGEPGIGKSSLLAMLAAHARERGVEVLSVRGVQNEGELAFSTLGDLLSPLEGLLAELPTPQADALAGALALAPPPPPGERLALCVAAHGLLGRSLSGRPRLAIVDDLHWADSASRECILFAARRAQGSLSVVVAIREGESAAAEAAGIPEVALEPLSETEAEELLAHEAGDLCPEARGAIIAAADGNPLALIELAAVLSPDERTGRTPLDLPLAPGPHLSVAYDGRIEGLPGSSRRALLVAAAFAGDDVRTIDAACRAMGIGAADLTACERAGLVEIRRGRMSFRHPLVRGAAYHRAGPIERRAAHGALASVLEGDQRAWHLGESVVGPDEAVAGEIEAAATAAAGRRAPGPASVAFERAARLSVADDQFARRLLCAAEGAGGAGQRERAMALADEAVEAIGDGPLRARARHVRALAMLWSGGIGPATEGLVSEATRVADIDPRHAAAMLADAACAQHAEGDTRYALALAERAAAALQPGDDAGLRAHVLSVLGWALVLRGQSGRARPYLEEAEHLVRNIDPLSTTGQTVLRSLNVRLSSGEFELAHAASCAVAAAARQAGALETLGTALLMVADASYRLGDWTGAQSALGECREAADASGDVAVLGHGATIAARLAAARGEEGAARESAGLALAAAEAGGMRSGAVLAGAALGFLELGLGRIEEAVARLGPVAALVDATGLEEPTLVPWAPDLIEAHARADRPRDAEAVLSVLARQARTADSPVGWALVSRCRGQLEGDFDAHFTEALRLDDARPMPFERARTLLAFGRRLHRARRRAEARARLRDALDIFERLGAAPWAAQARAEHRAAGGRRRAGHPPEELTSQERRIANAAARGATNREIASEFYLSTKTVEFHLGNVYRKLEIRSRAFLANALDAAGTAFDADDAT